MTRHSTTSPSRRGPSITAADIRTACAQLRRPRQPQPEFVPRAAGVGYAVAQVEAGRQIIVHPDFKREIDAEIARRTTP